MREPWTTLLAGVMVCLLLAGMALMVWEAIA